MLGELLVVTRWRELVPVRPKTRNSAFVLATMISSALCFVVGWYALTDWLCQVVLEIAGLASMHRRMLVRKKKLKPTAAPS